MIKFSKNIIRTFSDLPNKASLLINSIGCNLKCYQCFNYDLLVKNPIDVCDEEYILDQIKLNGFLFDSIIISGGEFLLNDIEEIHSFLNNIKSVFDGLITINTNGTSPNKMKELDYIVDGFHTDMKLPFYYMDSKVDKDIIKLTTGKHLTNTKIENILKSIELTIRLDKGYSQIRSVKYPFLDEKVFKENKEYINCLNKKYKKQTQHYVNEFVDIKEAIIN